MEARGPQKDMDIFLEVPRARIGILGLDFLGQGADLGTFKGFPLADLGAWGGGRQGRSQRGPGPPAEDPCGGGAGAAHRRAPGFMPGFMPCFNRWFQARFHGWSRPLGFQVLVSCPVSCPVSWGMKPKAGFMPSKKMCCHIYIHILVSEELPPALENKSAVCVSDCVHSVSFDIVPSRL